MASNSRVCKEPISAQIPRLHGRHLPCSSRRQISRTCGVQGTSQREGGFVGFGDTLASADRCYQAERPLSKPAQAAGQVLIAAASPEDPEDPEDPEEGPSSAPDAFSGASSAAQPSGAEDGSQEMDEETAKFLNELELDEDYAVALAEGPLEFEEGELRDHMQEYLEWSQEVFDIPELVEVLEGEGGLPCVSLQHPTGASARIYLHGANVVSWTMPDGRELLHTMAENDFDGRHAIRGGMPILFPQVGPGRQMKGGFMQDLHWSVVDSAVSFAYVEGDAEDPAPSVVLHAQDDPWTMSLFPHEFEALYTVSLMLPDEFDTPESDGQPERIRGPGPTREPSNQQQETQRRLSEGKFLFDPRQVEARKSRRRKNQPTVVAPSTAEEYAAMEEEELEEAVQQDDTDLPIQLRCKLDILNKSDTEMQFTTSLQGHWVVKDLNTYHPFVRTLGLGGRYMMDSADNPAHPQLRLENEDYLSFGRDHVDRVYINTYETEVRFCNGTPTHLELMPRQGFRDLHVLSPLMTEPDEAASFVSLAPAESTRIVRLQPGETWSGEMVFRSHDQYWEYPLFEQMKPGPYPGYEDEDRLTDVPPGPPGIDQNISRPETSSYGVIDAWNL